MATTGGPRIVRSGLILHLDAGQKTSYSGSGTSWIDLSGNRNNGTLTNGPTFNSLNGGSIAFDGINDYIDGPSISNLFTSDITAEAWIKITAMSSDWVRIIGTAKTNGADRTFGIWYWVDGGILWQRYGGTDPGIYPANPKLTIGSWFHVAATTNGSSHVLYLNGVNIGTATASGPWTASGQPITIGYAGFHTYTNSNISSVRLYTRGLTANEVLQNYNTTKGRFGL